MGGGAWFLGLAYYKTQRQLSCEKCHIPMTASWACPSGSTGYLSTSLRTNEEF